LNSCKLQANSGSKNTISTGVGVGGYPAVVSCQIIPALMTASIVRCGRGIICKKGAVEAVRQFLTNAGVKP
jgi:hypothetical protein